MKQKTFVVILIILFTIGLAVGLLSGRTTGAFARSYRASELGTGYESNFGNPVNLERSVYEEPLWSTASKLRRGGNAITTITINPNVIYGGEHLNVTIDPGMQGAHRDVMIWKINEQELGIIKKGRSARADPDAETSFCRSSFKCYETANFRYRTGRDWRPGVYQVRVYDYKLNDWAKANFTLLYKSNVEPFKFPNL